MARARNIKPALFRNEVLGVADPLYTLLFQSLWLLADREGRLEDRPVRIKADTFPYREGLNVDAMLTWLHDHGFIVRYEYRGNRDEYRGNRYIQVCNFTKHQNPHKNEAGSVIPSFSDGCTTSEKIGTTSEKIGTTSEKIGSTPADSLNLIPDSGFLKPDSLLSSPDFKSDDDEYFASLTEQEQKRQADADARIKFQMTPEWNHDKKVLDDHLKFLSHKAIVNGRVVTSADLTDEILADFRASAHRKQEIRTMHDWHGGLASYLVSRICNTSTTSTPNAPKNGLHGGHVENAPMLREYQPPVLPERTEETAANARKYMGQVKELLG